jgi:hypothetical protein
LQTRGRGGTRATQVRRGYNKNSVNGIGGEDDQYEDYYNVLHTSIDGGVNGIGKQLENTDSNNDDEEQEQQSEEEIHEDDLYVNYNLDNLDTLVSNRDKEKHEEEESWEEYDAQTTKMTDDEQIHTSRWGKDWNEQDEEQIRRINRHFTRGGGNTWNEDNEEEIDEVNRHFNL